MSLALGPTPVHVQYNQHWLQSGNREHNREYPQFCGGWLICGAGVSPAYVAADGSGRVFDATNREVIPKQARRLRHRRS
jgi:hypothetical protein